MSGQSPNDVVIDVGDVAATAETAEIEASLTISAAAAAIGVTDRQVRRLVVAGKLRKVGGRIAKTSIEQHLGRALDAVAAQDDSMIWVPASEFKRLVASEALAVARADSMAAQQLEWSGNKQADAARIAELEQRASELEAQQAEWSDSKSCDAAKIAELEQRAADLEAERNRLAEEAAKIPRGFWTKPRRLWPF